MGGLVSLFSKPYVPTQNPAAGAMASQQQAIQLQQQAYQSQAQNELDYSALTAQQKANEVTQFMGQQSEAYNNAGVMGTGSPLIQAEYTRTQGQQQIDMITRQGLNQANLSAMNSFAMGANSRAQLSGLQSQWITNRAQQTMQGQGNQLLAQTGALKSIITGLGAIGQGKAYQQLNP